MYDRAAALEHVRDDESYQAYRDALLEGYAEFGRMPAEELERLELFMAGFYVYYGLRGAAMTHARPARREELNARIERAAGLVGQFLAQDRPTAP